MAAEESAVITLYKKKEDRVGGMATVTLPDCYLYHFYEGINACGHPTEEMIAKVEDNNIGNDKV